MKIAMIGHKRIPSREGGVEIVVEQLAARMVEMGHTVHVYNRSGCHVSGKEFDNDKSDSKNYKGIRIITIPTLQNRKLNALIYSFIATLRAIFGQYEVIHYHAEGPCAMLWIPHLFGIRTVATIHGLDWQRAKWGGFASKYLKFGEKIAARYADEVIVLSKNMQEYFLDTYGRKTQFIPNGVLKPEKKESSLIKDKFGLEKDGYILFLGRIVPEKGLHYLVDAYKNLDTVKNLVIAGGSSHTDDYMASIKEKASSDNRIIFTDFVQGEMLKELYSNAYIYVFPSDLEGMPISLLEAMSYSNCCLVSDIPENTEVVEDKSICFSKSDVKDLEKKLQQLIEDTGEVEKCKNGASEFICSKYNWDDIVENTLKLYKVELYEKELGQLLAHN